MLTVHTAFVDLKYSDLHLEVWVIMSQATENPNLNLQNAPHTHSVIALSSQRVLLDFCLAGGLLISLRRRVEHITEWWLLHGRSTRNQYEIILQLRLAGVRPASTHHCQRPAGKRWKDCYGRNFMWEWNTVKVIKNWGLTVALSVSARLTTLSWPWSHWEFPHVKGENRKSGRCKHVSSDPWIASSDKRGNQRGQLLWI